MSTELLDHASIAGLVKARRTWRVNKADMERTVREAMALAEKRATDLVHAHMRAVHWKQRAKFWQAVAMAAWVAAVGFMLLQGAW